MKCRRAKVYLADGCEIRGLFVDGALEGVACGLDREGKLSFACSFRGGAPDGPCWKKVRRMTVKLPHQSYTNQNGVPNHNCHLRMIFLLLCQVHGDGCLYGRLDDLGRFTGDDIAYVYPDFVTCVRGRFHKSVLVVGKECSVVAASSPGPSDILELEGFGEVERFHIRLSCTTYGSEVPNYIQ